jgi:hypothetical protein
MKRKEAIPEENEFEDNDGIDDVDDEGKLLITVDEPIQDEPEELGGIVVSGLLNVQPNSDTYTPEIVYKYYSTLYGEDNLFWDTFVAQLNECIDIYSYFMKFEELFGFELYFKNALNEAIHSNSWANGNRKCVIYLLECPSYRKYFFTDETPTGILGLPYCEALARAELESVSNRTSFI